MRAHRTSLLAALALGGASSVRADLPFKLSDPISCLPLNITWTPASDAFPYVVWITSVLSAVQSYKINANYQRDANGDVTFQYVVPPQSATFNAFTVSVIDSKGNGNTSRPLAPGAAQGSCDPYTASNSFTWASDSLAFPNNLGAMAQCGRLHSYTVDNRGTQPFTYTFLPIQGTPMTVSVPRSATPNQTFFNYTDIVPIPSGTDFLLVAGDGVGGTSGGSSKLYQTADSPDGRDDCIQANYRLNNRYTAGGGALAPIDGPVASFANLPGAVDDATDTGTGGGNGTVPTDGSQPTSGAGSGGGGGGTNTGAVAGGVIGGCVALALVGAAGVAFWLFKRRQKRLRDEARREEDYFVDLDGDEDVQEQPGGGFLRARRGQNAGVRQSYNVSPFPYTPGTGSVTASQEGVAALPGVAIAAGDAGSAPSSRPGTAGAPAGVPASNLSRSSSQPSTVPLNLVTSGSGSIPPGSPPARTPAFDVQSAASAGGGNGSVAGHSARANTVLSGGTAGAGPAATFMTHQSHLSQGSVATTGTRGPMRVTNAIDESDAASGSQGTQQAGPLPSKRALLDAEDLDAGNNAASASRVIQHTDAGPIAAPPAPAQETVEELPPSYGGWAARMPSLKRGGANRTQQQDPQ